MPLGFCSTSERDSGRKQHVLAVPPGVTWTYSYLWNSTELACSLLSSAGSAGEHTQYRVRVRHYGECPLDPWMQKGFSISCLWEIKKDASIQQDMASWNKNCLDPRWILRHLISPFNMFEWVWLSKQLVAQFSSWDACIYSAIMKATEDCQEKLGIPFVI